MRSRLGLTIRKIEKPEINWVEKVTLSNGVIMLHVSAVVSMEMKKRHYIWSISNRMT